LILSRSQIQSTISTILHASCTVPQHLTFTIKDKDENQYFQSRSLTWQSVGFLTGGRIMQHFFAFQLACLCLSPLQRQHIQILGVQISAQFSGTLH